MCSLRINAHHHPSDGACSAPARGRRLCRSRCRSAPVREPEFPDAGGDLRHLLVASDPASPLGASKKPLPTLSWNDTPASTAGRSGGSGSGLAAQALTEALAPRRSHLRVLGKPTWRSGRGGRSNADLRSSRSRCGRFGGPESDPVSNRCRHADRAETGDVLVANFAADTAGLHEAKLRKTGL